MVEQIQQMKKQEIMKPTDEKGTKIKEETKIAESSEKLKEEIKKDVKKEQENKKENKIKKKDKEDKKEKIKKNEAVVNGRNLGISTKESVAVCNFIRNKDVDRAISKLEEVLKYKKAIPMKGEIPHRKGKIMSGRYPIKAVREFIKLLKSLKANSLVNELELEKFKIFCMANQASRPYRRFGQGRIKRSHVMIKLIPRGEIK